MKIEFAHIVAMARNRVIGNEGGLPWHIPSELKRFRKITTGHICVMGRTTFLSLPKFLVGRRLIVLSRDASLGQRFPDKGSDELAIVQSWKETENVIADDIQNREWPQLVYIIGGAQLYADTIHLARYLELTLIEKEVRGDTFYPPFSLDDYQITKEEFFGDEDVPYRCLSAKRKVDP